MGGRRLDRLRDQNRQVDVDGRELGAARNVARPLPPSQLAADLSAAERGFGPLPLPMARVG